MRKNFAEPAIPVSVWYSSAGGVSPFESYYKEKKSSRGEVAERRERGEGDERGGRNRQRTDRQKDEKGGCCPLLPLLFCTLYTFKK